MTLTNSYASLAEFNDQINIDDSADAAMGELALGAASRQIDRHTGWPHGFWQDSTVATREYYTDDPNCVYIPEGISTATGLIVKTDADQDGTYENTLTITTSFILSPVNAADQVPVEPWTELLIVDYGTSFFPTSYNARPGVQVTAKFGWPAIPDDVKKACLIQAVQLYKSTDAVFGVMQFGDGFATRVGRGLNPMAEALLEGYCRPRVG